MRIYKYKLDCLGEQTVSMPIGARILCLQIQNDVPCVWVVADTSAGHEWRVFSTYGTGHETLKYPGIYIGTYQLRNGALVFHVFEKEKS